MRLTEEELIMFRNNLLSKRSFKGQQLPCGAQIWEDWMEGTLNKITDELYPQGMDHI
uniref:Phage terminase large subunit n=1 Tax=uncultured marine virus TaxID=186617 RepID=A0A0F7LBC2_9VIRU|nr:phage terminase large subunit [uncultured marine virus]